MQFTWDFNTATLSFIIVQIAATIIWAVRTANTANGADKIARDARKLAQEAHEKIATLHGIVGLHKEAVARDYVDREAVREMKEDLMDAINRLSDRLDQVLDRERLEAKRP